MSITKIGADLSMPIERFILQMAIKYQIIGLKALEWYNAWSQDINMPYSQRAMDIYNAVETAIVNSCIPSKYKMNLLTQEQVEKEVIVLLIMRLLPVMLLLLRYRRRNAKRKSV